MPDRPAAWTWFHHPHLSVTVVRRRLAAALTDLAIQYGDAVRTRGRSLARAYFPEHGAAGRMALSRLRRQGVLVKPSASGVGLTLRVEAGGADRDLMHPERLWRQAWSGIWNVLSYDIAESERACRHHLRRFLRRLRVGCLHQSLWVTPRDIRPEFEDLKIAIGLQFSACLFEARTVSGDSPGQIVGRAWPWERIGDRQRWYLETGEKLVAQLGRRPPAGAEVVALAREELAAYRAAMEDDPLLPRSLWPPDYRGPAVRDLHQRFVRLLRPGLAALFPGRPV